MAIRLPIRLRCYAKINLGLLVLGARPDRYHELRTIFQTVSLFDTLEARLERGRTAIDFSCDVSEITGPENLVVRAAAAMAAELRLRGRIHLRLKKNIPMGAGLGGGSSDAAAALRAVAMLAGRSPRPERALEIAASLGADVPFFLLGGTALGLGRGTEVYGLKDIKRQWLVLGYPPVHVKTAEAYRQMDAHRALTESSETHKIYRFCASNWDRKGDRPEFEPVNDFEPVVFATYPKIASLKSFLIRAGASPALLSGSGSAVYGLYGSRQQAEIASRKLEARFPGVRVWVLRTVGRSESSKGVRGPDKRK